MSKVDTEAPFTGCATSPSQMRTYLSSLQVPPEEKERTVCFTFSLKSDGEREEMVTVVAEALQQYVVRGMSVRHVYLCDIHPSDDDRILFVKIVLAHIARAEHV